MQARGLRAAVVVIGMLVLPASALASPSQFITTKRGTEEPLAVRGSSGSEGKQKLVLPPFTVSCQAAHVTGGPAPGYAALRNFIKLSSCSTTLAAEEQSVTVPAKVKGVLDVFYKPEGNAELVNGFEVQMPALKCTIAIAEGAQLHNAYTGQSKTGEGAGKGRLPYKPLSVPSRNLRDFPSGYQQRLQIENEDIGLHYSFAGAGCANLEAEPAGEYAGSTVEEAVAGNLQFVPGSEWEQVENEAGEWNRIENKEVTESWNLEQIGKS